jgi:hypothetical protein
MIGSTIDSSSSEAEALRLANSGSCITIDTLADLSIEITFGFPRFFPALGSAIELLLLQIDLLLGRLTRIAGVVILALGVLNELLKGRHNFPSQVIPIKKISESKHYHS